MTKTKIAKSPCFNIGACVSGMAATEFALLLPVLVALLFGVVEGADALTANRRAALAANTLADLTAQETEILESDADDLFAGVAEIIGDDLAAMTIRLVSVVDDGGGNPVVHWSWDSAGAHPYAQNAPYTSLPNAALLDPTASVIVAEVSYPYTPPISQHFISSVTLEKIASRWTPPSVRVQLCVSPGDCT